MTEMIERVARAIARMTADERGWEFWIPEARAAIEAMREPTGEQRLVGALSLLREAYRHLAADSVVQQRLLANGLIAPAIRRLEVLLRTGDAATCGENKTGNAQ